MGSRTGHVTIFVFNINGKHAPLALPTRKRDSLASWWGRRSLVIVWVRWPRHTRRASDNAAIATYQVPVWAPAISRRLASIPFISRGQPGTYDLRWVDPKLNNLRAEWSKNLCLFSVDNASPLSLLIRCCLAVTIPKIRSIPIETLERDGERKFCCEGESAMGARQSAANIASTSQSLGGHTEFSDRLTRSYCFELYSGQTTMPSTRHSRKISTRRGAAVFEMIVHPFNCLSPHSIRLQYEIYLNIFQGPFCQFCSTRKP